VGAVISLGAALWGPYPLRRYVELARRAERGGFDTLWLGDTQLLTSDLYSALALCADATSTIRLGSAVTNTVTRDLTVTAGGFLALQEFSGGRCLLGIGVGGSAVHTVGLAEDPARVFREKVATLRRLVRGEELTRQGVVARGKIAAAPIPVHVASSSPLGLEIAGQLADGVILNVGVEPSRVREAMERVAHGARAAGRDVGALDVAVMAGAAIRSDRAAALDVTRSWAATTARRVARWMTAGGEELRRVGDAVRAQYRWDDHIRAGAAHARPVTDELARQFVLAGTADDVAATIAALAGCGVGHVIALAMGDPGETLDAFSRDIIPRWRRAPAPTGSAT
jgi:5,10-methylenetetrahydromethanopterin reductase